MRYEERPPSPAFSAFVESYWAFALEAGDPQSVDHVIVPDGTVSVSVSDAGPHGRRLMVTGPLVVARHVEVRRGARYMGARLRAGTARAVLGVAPPTGLVSLADAAPAVAGRLATAGMPPDLAAFAALFEAGVTPDKARLDVEVLALAQAITACDGVEPLERLMSGREVGARQLRRRFVAETGLTPKTYSRLRRVRRACINLAAQVVGELAAVSAEAGYADQPHFTRELKSVFGMAPHMLHQYLRQIRHLNVA